MNANLERKNKEQQIALFCSRSSAAEVDFIAVLIAINNKIIAPYSFHFYANLCTFDSKVHWDLEKKSLLDQSNDCIDFILKAFE